MTTTRIHHALPAPVVHAGFSVPQSKSHVLAGVQDAYWSDDEAVRSLLRVYFHKSNFCCEIQEDAECPLCLEEMDISDLNFKPCVCGYQVIPSQYPQVKKSLLILIRRFVGSAGTTSRRISTSDALLAEGCTPTKLWSSSRLPLKSMCLFLP